VRPETTPGSSPKKPKQASSIKGNFIANLDVEIVVDELVWLLKTELPTRNCSAFEFVAKSLVFAKRRSTNPLETYHLRLAFSSLDCRLVTENKHTKEIMSVRHFMKSTADLGEDERAAFVVDFKLMKTYRNNPFDQEGNDSRLLFRVSIKTVQFKVDFQTAMHLDRLLQKIARIAPSKILTSKEILNYRKQVDRLGRGESVSKYESFKNNSAKFISEMDQLAELEFDFEADEQGFKNLDEEALSRRLLDEIAIKMEERAVEQKLLDIDFDLKLDAVYVVYFAEEMSHRTQAEWVFWDGLGAEFNRSLECFLELDLINYEQDHLLLRMTNIGSSYKNSESMDIACSVGGLNLTRHCLDFEEPNLMQKDSLYSHNAPQDSFTASEVSKSGMNLRSVVEQEVIPEEGDSIYFSTDEKKPFSNITLLSLVPEIGQTNAVALLKLKLADEKNVQLEFCIEPRIDAFIQLDLITALLPEQVEAQMNQISRYAASEKRQCQSEEFQKGEMKRLYNGIQKQELKQSFQRKILEFINDSYSEDKVRLLAQELLTRSRLFENLGFTLLISNILVKIQASKKAPEIYSVEVKELSISSERAGLNTRASLNSLTVKLRDKALQNVISGREEFLLLSYVNSSSDYLYFGHSDKELLLHLGQIKLVASEYRIDAIARLSEAFRSQTEAIRPFLRSVSASVKSLWEQYELAYEFYEGESSVYSSYERLLESLHSPLFVTQRWETNILLKTVRLELEDDSDTVIKKALESRRYAMDEEDEEWCVVKNSGGYVTLREEVERKNRGLLDANGQYFMLAVLQLNDLGYLQGRGDGQGTVGFVQGVQVQDGKVPG
jgi:hypothetical protein